MTTVDIINEGIDTTGVIKLFDQHTYQYSTCDPVRDAIATLPNLINHQNITVSLDCRILISEPTYEFLNLNRLILIFGNLKLLLRKVEGKSSS